MNEKKWKRIMDQARGEARVNMERRKVVAVKLSTPRAARIVGSEWDYVAVCDSDECSICKARRLPW